MSWFELEQASNDLSPTLGRMVHFNFHAQVGFCAVCAISISFRSVEALWRHHFLDSAFKLTRCMGPAADVHLAWQTLDECVWRRPNNKKNSCQLVAVDSSEYESINHQNYTPPTC